MEKEFVPYEPSLDLKELGFDEPCFAIYTTYSTVNKRNYKNPVLKIVRQKSQFTQKGVTKASTFSQAFRWFRDNYSIFSSIDVNYCYKIYVNDEFFEESINYNSHEEAEIECLKKLIEIVKSQKTKSIT